MFAREWAGTPTYLLDAKWRYMCISSYYAPLRERLVGQHKVTQRLEAELCPASDDKSVYAYEQHTYQHYIGKA